jgi:hypothetical protein
MKYEIVNKEVKRGLILNKIAKWTMVFASIVNKLVLNAIMYITTFFESEVQYGASAVDDEILERISYDKEQNEFQNNSE